VKQLRPRQQTAIAMLRQSLGKGNKRVMVKAPTGFGKTIIAAHIIDMARQKGNRVIFCVNAISLVDQTAQKFAEEGIEGIGVIQGQHEMTNYAMPVQIASVQTLQRRRSIPDADLVIIDESHNWFKFYGEWMKRWDAIPFIGLSATPYTKGLGNYYQDLIIPVTTEDLISEGWLSPFRVYAPAHPDLTGVRTLAGDYHEGDLSKAMDKSPLIADIVTMWKKYGEDRQTLCYGVNRAHAKHIKQEFESAGIPCGYIDSYTEMDERRQIAKHFKDGDIRIICNVGVLTTGIDWDVRCIILARPTKSEMLFQQIIGRGLRTAEGKQDCIIIDHSDTHLRLGFVTDIDYKHEKLCDGKPKKKSEQGPKEDPLPKECSKCHYLKPPKVHVCPQCGFKPEKQSDVEVVEGELSELKRKKSNNRQHTPEQKANFYAELVHYGRQKGYKPGWSSNKYKEKYGVWPNKVDKLPPKEPTPDTLNWITSQNIKNAYRVKPRPKKADKPKHEVDKEYLRKVRDRNLESLAGLRQIVEAQR